MEPRISLVTLAVADLAAARAFYLDGLGWEAYLDVPDEVVMIRVGERQILSLWCEAGFEAEIGPIRRGPGVVPIALAHNVETAEQVDEILAMAGRAGAQVWPPVIREWGGYSGYFADPDGYRWEIAGNPPGHTGDSPLPAV